MPSTIVSLLKDRALQRGVKVKLASGRESDIYVDCKRVTLHGPSLREVGKLLTNFLREQKSKPVFVAGVSVGIVRGEPRLDLEYIEDVVADVDMNVVMSSEGGFVEVQGTGENSTFDRAELGALLDLATRGLRELDTQQQAALGH